MPTPPRLHLVSCLHVVAALVVLAACASSEERPRTEDDARQLAPLPACIAEVGAAKGGAGALRSLREEQIWPLVYPGFDPKKGLLAEDTLGCTGRAPLREKGLVDPSGTPAKIDEGAITMGGGGDRLKVAWLRSETYADGTMGGALAVLRSLEGTAEVFALGGFRGRATTTFSIERIGSEVVVVALEEGCAARKPTEGCETTASVFRPRLGALPRVATIAPERITYATGSEPGIRGRIEYRLSSAIQYVDGGIRVLEQVMVRDELGREVRRAELERAYTFAPGGAMVVDADSLWSRLVVPPTKPK